MIAIGIDIGGTSIKGAAIDSNGRVYEKFSMPFVKDEKGENTIRKLAELVKEYIAAHKLEKKIVGIGIGSPGTLDVSKGIVVSANAVLINSKGKFVWVVEDGCATRRQITLSGYSGNGVIVSEGLKIGDRVIVEGYQKVSEGMKVSEK